MGKQRCIIEKNLLLKSLKLTAILLLAVTVHLFFSLFHGPVDISRGILSLAPLALLVISGAVLANKLSCVSASALQSGLLIAYYVLFGCAILGATRWGPPTLAEAWRRPVFPFSEPSHFAIAIIPVMLFCSVVSRGLQRLFVICSIFILPILMINLTLVFGLFFVVILSFLIPQLLCFVGIVFAVFFQTDLSYFLERVDFGGEGNNLSKLVYVQGWQMIGEAWTRSGGLGIGMQQLGVFGTEVPASLLIYSLRQGEDMNLLDGSFLFAKFGSDFGIFGFILAALLSIAALRSALFLRKEATSPGLSELQPFIVLAHCSIATFPIELFVRSTGYFTGTSLLLSASLWILYGRRLPQFSS